MKFKEIVYERDDGKLVMLKIDITNILSGMGQLIKYGIFLNLSGPVLLEENTKDLEEDCKSSGLGVYFVLMADIGLEILTIDNLPVDPRCLLEKYYFLISSHEDLTNSYRKII